MTIGDKDNEDYLRVPYIPIILLLQGGGGPPEVYYSQETTGLTLRGPRSQLSVMIFHSCSSHARGLQLAKSVKNIEQS